MDRSVAADSSDEETVGVPEEEILDRLEGLELLEESPVRHQAVSYDPAAFQTRAEEEESPVRPHRTSQSKLPLLDMGACQLSLVPFPMEKEIEQLMSNSTRAVQLFCLTAKALAALSRSPQDEYSAALASLQRLLRAQTTTADATVAFVSSTKNHVWLKKSALADLDHQRTRIESSSHPLRQLGHASDGESWSQQEYARVGQLKQLMQDDLDQIGILRRLASPVRSASPQKQYKRSRWTACFACSKPPQTLDDIAALPQDGRRSTQTRVSGSVSSGNTSQGQIMFQLERFTQRDTGEEQGTDVVSLYELLIWSLYQSENTTHLESPAIAVGDHPRPITVGSSELSLHLSPESQSILSAFCIYYGIPAPLDSLVELKLLLLHREATVPFFQRLHLLLCRLDTSETKADPFLIERDQGNYHITAPCTWSSIDRNVRSLLVKHTSLWSTHCLQLYHSFFRHSNRVEQRDMYRATLALEVCLDVFVLSTRIVEHVDETTAVLRLPSLIQTAITERYTQLLMDALTMSNDAVDATAVQHRNTARVMSSPMHLEEFQTYAASRLAQPPSTESCIQSLKHASFLLQQVMTDIQRDVEYFGASLSEFLANNDSLETMLKNGYYNLVIYDLQQCVVDQQCSWTAVPAPVMTVETDDGTVRTVKVVYSRPSFGLDTEQRVDLVPERVDAALFAVRRHLTVYMEFSGRTGPSVAESNVWFRPLMDRWLKEQEFQLSVVALSPHRQHHTRLQNLIQEDSWTKIDGLGCSSSLLDLFRFLHRIYDAFTTSAPYLPHHVLKLATLVSHAVTSYVSALAKLLVHELEQEEAKLVWGVSLTDYGRPKIDISPSIFVMLNNMLYARIQLQSFILDQDVHTVYTERLDDPSCELDADTEDMLSCASSLRYIHSILGFFEERIAGGIAFMWKKALFEIAHKGPKTREMDHATLDDRIAPVMRDMSTKYTVFQREIGTSRSEMDVIHHNSFLRIVQFALTEVAFFCEGCLLVRRTRRVLCPPQILRLQYCFGLVRSLHSTYGITVEQQNADAGVTRTNALLELLTSPTLRLVETYESILTDTSHEVEADRVQSWPFISRAALRKAIKARKRYMKDAVAQEFIKKYPSNSMMQKMKNRVSKVKKGYFARKG